MGGDTVFPDSTGKGRTRSVKSCVSVKPKMGDALLFWSMKPDGSRDLRPASGAKPTPHPPLPIHLASITPAHPNPKF
jgi:hypothetical protein